MSSNMLSGVPAIKKSPFWDKEQSPARIEELLLQGEKTFAIALRSAQYLKFAFIKTWVELKGRISAELKKRTTLVDSSSLSSFVLIQVTW